MPMNAPRASRSAFLLRCFSATLLFVVASSAASAQTESGGLASATVSGFIINDQAEASFAASVGYRFNRVVAVALELTVVPSFTPSVPALPSPLIITAIYPAPIYKYEPIGGHVTIFTGNLRLAVPTRFKRVSPYMI